MYMDKYTLMGFIHVWLKSSLQTRDIGDYEVYMKITWVKFSSSAYRKSIWELCLATVQLWCAKRNEVNVRSYGFHRLPKNEDTQKRWMT